MRNGCKVFVLKGAGPFPTIPANVFYGAVNLDTVAQTANVTFYGASNAYDGASTIASANALGSGAGTPTLQLQDGVKLDEGYLSFGTDATITGKGIAVYYDVVIH